MAPCKHTKLLASLADDGTLDTVVVVGCFTCGERETHRLDAEAVAPYRDPDGSLSDASLSELVRDFGLYDDFDDDHTRAWS